SRRQLELVAWAIVALSVAATIVGAVQIFGGDIAAAWPAGYRQPSFVGIHDFAALSAATLLLGLTGLILGVDTQRRRALSRIAVASGLPGVVLSAAAAAVVGILLALGGLGLVAWRRRRLDLRRAAG